MLAPYELDLNGGGGEPVVEIAIDTPLGVVRTTTFALRARGLPVTHAGATKLAYDLIDSEHN